MYLPVPGLWLTAGVWANHDSENPESRIPRHPAAIPTGTGRPALHNDVMPKVVAVVGASSDRTKFGNKALRAFQAEGHAVVPINPNEREVEGIPTYASVLDVPGTIDMATVYVPPEIGRRLLIEFAQKRIPEIWINPGAESDELLAEAKDRKLNAIAACSVIAVGRNPYSF